MSKHSPENFIKFKINNNTYMLHRNVLNKMHIFNVLTDIPSSDNEMLDIQYDIDAETIDNIFDFLSVNDPHIFKQTTMIHTISVIKFMKYMGIDNSYIKQAFSYLNPRLSHCDFYTECAKLPYDSEMKSMLSYIRNDGKIHTYDSGINIIKNIMKDFEITKFPYDFNLKLIYKIVKSTISVDDFNIYLSIGIMHILNKTTEYYRAKYPDAKYVSDNILEFPKIIEIYKSVVDYDVHIHSIYCENNTISKFIINGEIVDFYGKVDVYANGYDNNIDIGTIKINLQSTIAMHMAKILMSSK